MRRKPSSLKVVVAYLAKSGSPASERRYALDTMTSVLDSTRRQLGSLKAGLGQAVAVVWGSDPRIKQLVDPIKRQADDLFVALSDLEKKLP